ncbi:hypothetical protein LZ554_005556 [Drepanopeziza brunnea f. sp. 'monogermtubi']|nr:hypothetical protein LZ554_005556 [Drepanopeziza brunnea f. sp. 'monogermtubi']
MRLKSLIRRAVRLGITNVWTAIYTAFHGSFQGSKPPGKHIKIDDEESQYDDDSLYPQHQSSLYTMWHILSSPISAPFITLVSLIILIILITCIVHLVYKPPTLIIRMLQHHNRKVIFHVPLPSSQRVVALTIDDAPSSETGKILDLLKAHSAKATFFVIGSQVAEHPGVVERIHAEGHELGNHAWTDDPSFKLPLTELSRQIREVEALLPPNENGMKYFRPGSGWFNAKMQRTVEALGYRLALGSVYPHDPQIHKPKWNARHVLSMVKPGSVVIMHDRRPYSAEQLGLILQGFEKDEKRKWTADSLGGLLALAEKQNKLV